MMQTNYSYGKVIEADFAATVEKTTAALKKEGFGILTTIDVKAKMKEKLGEKIEAYTILGACHPPSALKALRAEQEIGLMFPCNVIVYEKHGLVHVSAIRPTRVMKSANTIGLAAVAEEVEKKLKTVIDSL
jgi:uncharacterized protein (DUF302 family)